MLKKQKQPKRNRKRVLLMVPKAHSALSNSTSNYHSEQHSSELKRPV